MKETHKTLKIAVKKEEQEPGGKDEVQEGGGETGIEQRLIKTEEELKSLNDRYLRVCAEFENYKKRSERQASEFRKFANESLLKELLPVVDNLERALEGFSCNAEARPLAEGVAMTQKDLLKVLTQNGVSVVSSLGAPFDPCVHHALSVEPSPNNPENTVLREIQKGYKLKDRLLRPALVVVCQGQKEPECRTEAVSANEASSDQTETEKDEKDKEE
jgi:molecular chaperone GrpE